MSGAVVAAIAAVASALVTGYMAYRAKRTEADSPVSVAGGYSSLLDDHRKLLDVLRADLAQQHIQIAELRLAVDHAVEAERRCMDRLAKVQAELDDLRSRFNEHKETP